MASSTTRASEESPTVITVATRAHLSVHVHHTFLGAVLVPMTRLPTRLSLLCQGALAALFVQGLAAWGWEPIWGQSSPLPLPLALTAGGGSVSMRHGRSQITNVSTAMVEIAWDDGWLEEANVTTTSVALRWRPLANGKFGGALLLMNGVEMYRGESATYTRAGLLPFTPYAFQLAMPGNPSKPPVQYSSTFLFRTCPLPRRSLGLGCSAYDPSLFGLDDDDGGDSPGGARAGASAS